MGTALHEAPALEALDAIVPVPLHRTRRLERGYNQSAALARGLAEHLDAPCRPAWLTRPRPTRSQTHLSRRERWQNVAGAFDVPQPLPNGCALLLVDDVLTTGATVTAAARVLRRAGAGSVHLATLAMAE
jgi:ComF family protein